MGKQTWAAGVLLGVGLIAAFESSKLTLGTASLPGPGFFPFWLSLGLILTSAALLVQSLRQKLPDPGATGADADPISRSKPALALLAMLVYALVLEWVGFVLSTFIVLVVLWRIAEVRNWRAAIAGSLAAVAVTYLLFRLLAVQIPMVPQFL